MPERSEKPIIPMKLMELNLINFKGIRNFTLSLNGQEANVYGDNATGKTTLADAFLWLLFGKNSKNQKDFEIKTLDEDGQAISGIDHEVSAKLDIGGKTVELRRVYYEKWQKKRGSTTKEFTGHSTDYYIDGVPAKEKEYKEFIAEIINENTFRLLIDPYYFSETLPWQSRRELLFNVCGDIEDKDIINTDPELAELASILNGRSIDKHRKFVLDKRRDINQELNDIPVRIDEANRAILNGNGNKSDESELTKQIEFIKNGIGKKRQEKIDLQQGGGIPEKRKDLAEIESQMKRYQFEYENSFDKSLSTLKSELRAIENQMEDIDAKYSRKQRILDENEENVERLEGEMASLREQWYKTDAEKFACELSETCPTCGQTLPEEQIQATYEKALADFNKHKSLASERIQTEGKAKKEKADKLKAESKALAEVIADLNAERQKLDAQATGYDNKIDALRATKEDYINDKEYVELSEKKAGLAAEISKLEDGQNKDAISTIDEEIETLEKQLAEAEGSLAQIKQAKAIKSRIEDLKRQERDLAKEYERLNKELALLDQFVATKAKMTDENINKRFKMARFKMFRPHINGGLEECCDVMDTNKVPYSFGLNKGAQNNIGLDIINTLAEYYGFASPIFIDGAEAITNIIKTHGQQIKLYVQANQPTLKVLTA